MIRVPRLVLFFVLVSLLGILAAPVGAQENTFDPCYARILAVSSVEGGMAYIALIEGDIELFVGLAEDDLFTHFALLRIPLHSCMYERVYLPQITLEVVSAPQ